MSWRPVPCLVAMQRDLDTAYPHRVKPDWIIGDADHSSRVSDHNPEDPDPGEGNWEEVHAIDIRLGGDLNVRQVLNAVIGDPRVWYVIHNRIIYSRTYGWEARSYNGANAHLTHIHVSTRYGERWERDTSDWGFTPEPAPKPRTKPLPVDLSHLREQFLRAIDEETGKLHECPHVKRVQRALRVRDGADLKADGYVGKRTLNAWGHWEDRAKGSGRPRVPDHDSLAALVQPRWRMVS